MLSAIVGVLILNLRRRLFTLLLLLLLSFLLLLFCFVLLFCTFRGGTKSELNARVTQALNSNGSTDTMAVMTRVMEMVQQQIVQQTAQSAVQQQLTELLIGQQRALQERHYEMMQRQKQTQKDMIDALRMTKPKNPSL